jgi:hypothetical protein
MTVRHELGKRRVSARLGRAGVNGEHPVSCERAVFLRVEARGAEAYLKQYVEEPSGEPARHTKLRLSRRVRSHRGGESFCHRLCVQARRCRACEVERHLVDLARELRP